MIYNTRKFLTVSTCSNTPIYIYIYIYIYCKQGSKRFARPTQQAQSKCTENVTNHRRLRYVAHNWKAVPSLLSVRRCLSQSPALSLIILSICLSVAGCQCQQLLQVPRLVPAGHVQAAGVLLVRPGRHQSRKNQQLCKQFHNYETRQYLQCVQSKRRKLPTETYTITSSTVIPCTLSFTVSSILSTVLFTVSCSLHCVLHYAMHCVLHYAFDSVLHYALHCFLYPVHCPSLYPSLCTSLFPVLCPLSFSVSFAMLFTVSFTAHTLSPALQAGRSRVRFQMVSLEFFIAIILPAALWFWSRLSLQQKWLPGIFPGIKAAGAYGWLPSLLKSGSLNLLEPYGPVQASNGIAVLWISIWRSSHYLLQCNSPWRRRKLVGFVACVITEFLGV